MASSDSLDTLSTATGISRDTMLELWASVRANSALLDTCPRHDFEDQTPGKLLGKTFRCRACGGTADGVAVSWYQKGLAHGRAE